MWKKTLLAGTAALALVGSSLVYAQQQPAGDTGSSDQQGGGRPQITAQDRAAFLDARIAALKAGLQLTSDQEKNWPAFETALRNIAKVRAEHREARRQAWEQRQQAQQGGQQQAPSAQSHVDRLRRQAEALSSFGAALKQLADAEQPLLASLDDGQKRRFAMLAHMMRHHRMAFMHGEREGWRGGMRERWERWRHGGGDGDRDGGWRGHGRDGGDGDHGGPGGRTDNGSNDTTNGAAGDLDAE